MNDLELARTIARKFHAGQKYGNNDYMYHLEAVTEKALDDFDDRLAVIAMLHDILEDTACTLSTLHALFDKDICNAVVAVTKLFADASYEDYIARCKANPLARKVKMYDSSANMEESMRRGDMKRVLKYANQIKLLAE